ncbi:MAG: FAD-dependent oxidoreductase [Candidatus Nomurabacteria bacterium]|jgi:thioredoxin reductase (NADPH)|nr:FAD-dependent oxidoreductase [Candidatus Nomurabacteria bacterium]
MSEIYDVAMVGAGPSALAAAIYTTREDLATVLIEKGVIGGMIATADKVDNYPGFPDGIAGLDLAADFQAQAERFGAEIRLGEVLKIERAEDLIKLTTDDGEISARAVLIATGAGYKHIGIGGENEFAHYCATCDGAFFKGKKLACIGGGNSAVQETLYLTKFASHIELLVRSHIKASAVLQDELKKAVEAEKITLRENWTPDEIVADGGQTIGLRGHLTDSGAAQKVDCDGVFVFAGLKPNTDWLKNSVVELTGRGLIKTDENLMTKLAGVFAAGDCRDGATMQVAAAIGDGATAALKIREYLTRNK